jgi:hypothetical protein
MPKLSRRRVMGLLSVPAVASLASVAPAEDAAPPADARADRGARVYNIREHGAKGDGTTLDTAAVQAAIDAANADDGGTVLVPAGDFLIGTVELKSHVTLRIAAKGRLLGSGDIKDYHAGRNIPRGNGNIVLLSAADAENVSIEGPGTIDGQGAKWYTGKGDMTGPNQDSSQGYFNRPHLLIFSNCQNVRMRDVFLSSSAYHCVRILRCKQVKLDGVRIHNRVNKNNDGFHINSSEYVHIVNCDVACQDDACALFGSNKFVTVTNSTFSTRWSCFRFGGGEPENITISNCVIYETYGCAIKIGMGRGGRMENVTFSNLILKDVTGPISIGLSKGNPIGRDGTPRPAGIVRNLRFEGIRGTVVAEGRQHADLLDKSSFRHNEKESERRSCIVVNSVADEPIEGITFTDVHLTFGGGGSVAESRREIPKVAGEYFLIGPPPAYGLYARNARGLTLNNVRFGVETPDLRPAVVFERVEDAVITGLTAQGNAEAESLLRFTAVKDVLLTSPRVTGSSSVFLRVEGTGNENVKIEGGDLTRAQSATSFGEGVSETSVRQG